MATPRRTPDPAAVARLESLLEKIREKALRMMEHPQRRELHVVVVVEGHQVTPGSHLLSRDYPLDGA